MLYKLIAVFIASFLGIQGSLWLFNHVNAWLGVATAVIVFVIAFIGFDHITKSDKNKQ